MPGWVQHDNPSRIWLNIGDGRTVGNGKSGLVFEIEIGTAQVQVNDRRAGPHGLHVRIDSLGDQDIPSNTHGRGRARAPDDRAIEKRGIEASKLIVIRAVQRHRDDG